MLVISNYKLPNYYLINKLKLKNNTNIEFYGKIKIKEN